MTTDVKRLTVEAFWKDYADRDFELSEGKLIEVSPSGKKASNVGGLVLTFINMYLLENPIGETTGADGGYQLDEDTLRAPDVGYYANEKIARVEDDDKYLPFAPDLAVEVVSPSNSMADMQTKIGEYFRAGTKLVWVLFPKTREAVVWYPDGTAKIVTDSLDGEDVLPGFSLELAKVWPQDLP